MVRSSLSVPLCKVAGLLKLLFMPPYTPICISAAAGASAMPRPSTAAAAIKLSDRTLRGLDMRPILTCCNSSRLASRPLRTFDDSCSNDGALVAKTQRRGRAGSGGRHVAAAAAAIAGADLPNQVAAVLAVIGAETAFAGIVGEATEFGAFVQGADGVGRQRAEAHGRNVEDRSGIGLEAVGSADANAKGIASGGPRSDRMVHPFVLIGVNVVLRAKRSLVEHAFGTLVDDGTLVARKRQAVLVVLEKILPHLRSDLFQQEAQVRGNRIVAKDGVFGLQQIAQPQ